MDLNWGSKPEQNSLIMRILKKNRNHFYIFFNSFLFSKKKSISFAFQNVAKVAQLVEHNLAKVRVASSSLVFRSKSFLKTFTDAQVVELVDTKDLKSFDHYGRAGSSPAPGTLCESSSVGRA